MSIVRNGQSTNRAVRSITQKKFSVSDHVLVVGGSGRLGRLLRIAWPQSSTVQLIWQARQPNPGADLVFDPLADADTYRREAEGACAIFNLAGRVAGNADDMSLHRELALAALNAAQASGVRHVFLTSSAAVYGKCLGPAKEGGLTKPVSAYGQAKLDMEDAARDWANKFGAQAPGITCLRIGNVAGADQLLTRKYHDLIDLDTFPDGRSPRRSYIGPRALAAILARLFEHVSTGKTLPFLLNVALDGAVAMDALLAADARSWNPRKAGAGAIAEVRLDVSRLLGLTGQFEVAANAAEIVADMRWAEEQGRVHATVKTSF
jgi:nucleoside-diphosphate-sugar epimerase